MRVKEEGWMLGNRLEDAECARGSWRGDVYGMERGWGYTKDSRSFQGLQLGREGGPGVRKSFADPRRANSRWKIGSSEYTLYVRYVVKERRNQR